MKELLEILEKLIEIIEGLEYIDANIRWELNEAKRIIKKYKN